MQFVPFAGSLWNKKNQHGKVQGVKGWLPCTEHRKDLLYIMGALIYVSDAGDRLWVKVTPLVKEWHHQDTSSTQDLSEDSVDIQDVRNRSGVWPIVEAAVR